MTEHTPLTEKQLEEISARVFEKLQAQIGRSTVKVVVWLIATGVTGLLVWAGILHEPTLSH